MMPCCAFVSFCGLEEVLRSNRFFYVYVNALGLDWLQISGGGSGWVVREKSGPFVNLLRGLFVLLIRVCEAAAESKQYVYIV